MMKFLALVCTGLVLGAGDAATAGVCAPCSVAASAGGVVCGVSSGGARREFASSCEMKRHNCIVGSQAYTLSSTGACATSAAAASVAKSPAISRSSSKYFVMPGSAQYGVQCGNCAGTATSAVCGRNTQARLVTFINVCWMNLNNCYNPASKYQFVNNGYCAGTAAPAPVATPAKVNGVDGGVSTHPNLYMINSAECGRLPVAGKILNGQDAGLFQYPWAVSLSISEPALGKSYSCGGSVISARYVLSAAHCASGFQSAISITADLGDYVLSTSPDCALVRGSRVCAAQPRWIPVTEAWVHPLYNNDTAAGYDLSLLRL